jgi:hypothetical protein
MTRLRRYTALCFTLAAVLLAGTACDSALDEEPQTFRNPDNYFQEPSEVRAGTNGVYRPLYTYNGFKFPLWADAACGNDLTFCLSYFSGGMTGQGWEGKFWQGNAWRGAYEVIARANTVIQNVPDSPVRDDLKDWAMGQAHFLRGYAYQVLAIRYGDAPVRDNLYNPSDGAFGNAERDPVHDVFNQATADLQVAAERLPDDYSTGYQRGRPTAAAAKGLLAKVYLHMAGDLFTTNQSEPEWYDETLASNTQTYLDSARVWAGEVVDQAQATGYPSLADNYMDLFDTAAQDQVDENLFTIQAAPHSDGQLPQGSEIPQYYNPQGIDIDGTRFHGGLNLGAASFRYRWVQSQEEGDERFAPGSAFHESWLRYSSDRTYVEEAIPDDAVNCNPDLASNASVQSTFEGVQWAVNDTFCGTEDGGFIRVAPRYFTAKYVDPGANSKFENGSNPVVLRYADVLLVYAEALARTGSPQQAVTQLNKVRRRAGASTYDSPSDVPESSLTRAIWAERARELYAEQDRRWDLLRQGRFFERMAAVGKSRPPRRRLLPLPSEEINGNELIDTNNPGY